VRVRAALAVALALVVGALVLIMSGRAARLSGTDHTNPNEFVATLHSGQELCQPGMLLPNDAQRVEILVGTYGHPVPALAMRFLAASGQLTSGRLAPGAKEGDVSVPLRYPHGPTVGGTLCVHVGASPANTVLGGDVFAPGPSSEQVDGKPQGGRISVSYLRPGRESWWQLLPTLDRRFGLGKASFFGDWTLPVAALVLLGVWVAAARLLVREST
jgi:hypothetical protein